MPIAIGVLVLLAAIAVFVLTRLDLGDEAPRKATKRPAASTTTSTTTATTTTTVGRPVRYEVRPGDTLLGIARRFGVTTDAIVKANSIPNADRLTIGQVLLIPPRPVIRLVLTPRQVTAGGSVQLVLTGAQPAEKVTFRIDSPAGSFTGPPHTAAPDGKVTATYAPEAANPPGNYTVTAQGDRGTTASAILVVGAA